MYLPISEEEYQERYIREQEPWKLTRQSPFDWFKDNFPKFMVTQDHILRNRKKYVPGKSPLYSGIYFLIFDGLIVYVGKSNHFDRRFIQHYKTGLEFGEYWTIGGIPELFVEAVEAFYIHAADPFFNIKYPPPHDVVIPHLDSFNFFEWHKDDM
jgi:hypothetical protein